MKGMQGTISNVKETLRSYMQENPQRNQVMIDMRAAATRKTITHKKVSAFSNSSLLYVSGSYIKMNRAPTNWGPLDPLKAETV